MDPEFAKNIGQIVLLGGSFAVNGNANPAAEANVNISILYPTS
jgi:inosine-uridine nucleoside N-ribohydrolase